MLTFLIGTVEDLFYLLSTNGNFVKLKLLSAKTVRILIVAYVVTV